MPKYKPSLRMIQRIQSLLLLGVVILLTVNLFVPIWTNQGDSPLVTLTAFSITSKGSGIASELIFFTKPSYYIGVLLCVCIALTLLIIFRYNNRLLQLKLCNLLILLTLGILGTYFIGISSAKELILKNATNENYEIGYFLPILSSMLILAARYFINKDEQLVRSADRMR